jgi:CO/xanthine dehydrogenase Mo-binding subunit
VLSPAIVHGQAVGGIAQGIGAALYEEITYDAEGQLLSSTFMDYLLPSAREIPKGIEVYELETPSPFNPLGAKGAGESSIIPPPAAIANAIADALSDFQVDITEYPLTPERVWQMIKKGQMNSQG